MLHCRSAAATAPPSLRLKPWLPHLLLWTKRLRTLGVKHCRFFLTKSQSSGKKFRIQEQKKKSKVDGEWLALVEVGAGFGAPAKKRRIEWKTSGDYLRATVIMKSSLRSKKQRKRKTWRSKIRKRTLVRLSILRRFKATKATLANRWKKAALPRRAVLALKKIEARNAKRKNSYVRMTTTKHQAGNGQIRRR